MKLFSLNIIYNIRRIRLDNNYIIDFIYELELKS
jgi:hypothetical protein